MGYERMTIHRDMLAAGQPRAYADSVYEAVLTYEFRGPYAERMRLGREVVARHAKMLVHSWSDEPQWYEPRLADLTETEPRVWYVKVTAPYLD